MARDEPTLSYESSIAGALLPGERVLWEDHPHTPLPPSPRQQPLRTAAVIVAVPVATALIAGIGTRGDVLVITLSTIAVIVLTAIGIIASTRRRASAQAELEHVFYRVTDRRVIRSDDRPRRGGTQTEIEQLTSIITTRGRRPNIIIDSVYFRDVPDVDSVSLLLLDLWAKSNRRRRVRRTPMNDSSSPPPAPDAPALPEGIALAAQEKVLWTGRPRAADPVDRWWLLGRLRTLAWLLIPAALLISSIGIIESAPRAHWVIGAFAIFWLLAGLNGMTLSPWFDTRRRARTWYVLTNVRAIVHETGRAGKTNSYLLDMSSGINIARRPDGAAQMWIGSMHFERLRDVDQVHAIALEAIRNAGTPAGGIITPHSPDEDSI